MGGKGPGPIEAVRPEIRREAVRRTPQRERGLPERRFGERPMLPERGRFELDIKDRPLERERELPRDRFPARPPMGMYFPPNGSISPYYFSPQGSANPSFGTYSTWNFPSSAYSAKPAFYSMPPFSTHLSGLDPLFLSSPGAMSLMREKAFHPPVKPTSFDVALKPPGFTPFQSATFNTTAITGSGLVIASFHVTGFVMGGAGDPVQEVLLVYHQQLARINRAARSEFEARFLAAKKWTERYEEALAIARQLARQAQNKFLLEGINLEAQSLEAFPQLWVN